MTFNEFKDRAMKILNIKLDGYKIKRVKRRTNSLMRRHNVADYEECLSLLQNDPDFKASYLSHFTINTTEFFRNPESFTYLQEEVIPDLNNRYDNINIWSAPCANGSEPYTLAIILNELNINSRNYQIVASDLDSEIIEIARTGIYGENSLKNVSQKLHKKYFKPVAGNDNKYKLDEKILNQVTFQQMDLINESYRQKWHLILSRNFFIYLTKDIKSKLTRKFTGALHPQGYLFLGNTEFIFNAKNFNLEKKHFSFYQKKTT